MNAKQIELVAAKIEKIMANGVDIKKATALAIKGVLAKETYDKAIKIMAERTFCTCCITDSPHDIRDTLRDNGGNIRVFADLLIERGFHVESYMDGSTMRIYEIFPPDGKYKDKKFIEKSLRYALRESLR